MISRDEVWGHRSQLTVRQESLCSWWSETQRDTGRTGECGQERDPLRRVKYEVSVLGTREDGSPRVGSGEGLLGSLTNGFRTTPSTP